MTPKTEAGRRHRHYWRLDDGCACGEWMPGTDEWAQASRDRAIEAEAREGYVPASLSPEWHAELNFVAAEAVTATLARLRAVVEGLPDCDICSICSAHRSHIDPAAVLRAIDEEAERG